jgi:hypothetical protein
MGLVFAPAYMMGMDRMYSSGRMRLSLARMSLINVLRGLTLLLMLLIHGMLRLRLTLSCGWLGATIPMRWDFSSSLEFSLTKWH